MIIMMPPIDRILSILKTGEVYTKEEIAENLNATNQTVKELLTFLSDYDLVVYDQRNQKAVIHPHLRKLIQEEENPKPEIVMIKMNGEFYLLKRKELIQFIKEKGKGVLREDITV